MIQNVGLNFNNNIGQRYTSLAQKPAHKAQSLSHNNAITEQLSFMGAINKPLVDSSAQIFNKYLENMTHYKIGDATLLVSKKKKEGPLYSKIIILPKPVKFINAIDQLGDVIFSQHQDGMPHIMLSRENFGFFRNALQENKAFRKTKIKGIIGQGGDATAFLTDKNEVIKLAVNPIFPDKNEMIKSELPILERYVLKNKSSVVYGVKEPLCENNAIKDITMEEYQKLWADFFGEIKAKDKRYDFQPDFAFDRLFSKQLGYKDDKWYILDHQIIKNRPLYEYKAKNNPA